MNVLKWEIIGLQKYDVEVISVSTITYLLNKLNGDNWKLQKQSEKHLKTLNRYCCEEKLRRGRFTMKAKWKIEKELKKWEALKGSGGN